MANIHLKQELTVEDKMALMQQDARFDVADTEAPDFEQIQADIRAPKGPQTAPKVFLSNDCIFNCSYCGCRCGRDVKTRYASTPREFAQMSYETAKDNGGKVFITSAIYKSPDYTEELIIESMRILRRELGYKGYLHAKIMPGTDPDLIRRAGLYANRLSVNIEVAKSEGYQMIARDKSKSNILGPMGQISRLIREAKAEESPYRPRFATSQTTQLMAGSTGEDDYTILNLSKALYSKYLLSRVYYTSYQYSHQAEGYEERPEVSTPLWRMSRLYQADRLMQLYGFTPEEITPGEAPNLVSDFDPKAAWALRNLHLFPIEVNTSEYEMLIRVPGIGITYAKRILEARRRCRVTHDVLRKLGVSLKRGKHFLTADGKYTGTHSSGAAEFTEALRSPLA
ncbi:MAG: biotin synthase [Oscillospiraceae bacterium]|nr:biotin synthase [Oscillospiraceae bacterium]